MIVSFSDTARVEQLFTDNRRELRGGSMRFSPPSGRRPSTKRLRVAAGLANPQVIDARSANTRESLPATLYIFSDGKFRRRRRLFAGQPQAGLRADRRSESGQRRHHGLQHQRTEEQARQAAGLRPAGEFRPGSGLWTRSAVVQSTATWKTQATWISPADAAAVVFDREDHESGVLQLRLGASATP